MERSFIEKYVFDHYQLYYAVSEADLQQVTLTTKNEEHNFFQGDSPHPANVSFKEYKTYSLPILFNKTHETEWFTVQQNHIIFEIDLIAHIFYFLSGWQEEKCKQFDQYGRFPYAESIQYKYSFVTQPVVNYYFEVLNKAFEKALNKPLPNKRSFEVFISHDIDELYTGWKEELKFNLKNFDLKNSFKSVFKGLFTNDYRNNIEEILSLEKKHNIRSTFFFLSSSIPSKKIKNADFDIESSAVQSILKQITDSSFEVGLHMPASDEGFSKEELNKQLKKLKTATIGNRHHYLALQQHQLSEFENTNLKYDSSLGFAEHIGFRHGIAYPFYPFNFKESKAFNTLEIPLLAMDRTLESASYMNCTPTEAQNQLMELAKTVQSVNGTFGLLWHNTFLFSDKYKAWHSVFEAFLSSPLISKGTSKTSAEILALTKK